MDNIYSHLMLYSELLKQTNNSNMSSLSESIYLQKL